MTYDGTGRTRAVTAPSAVAPASTSDDVALAIPETDIRRIELWCCERVPEHLWPQVKVEADVEPRHVTIVEVRPPWNLKFHEYDRKRPTKNVQVLLDYIADSGDLIFWG